MIELRYVRHLIAAASHPTVQDAADAIHLTQPALTKSIARFEEELDAKLFDRRGRRLVLTELGERLVERGEDLLRHVRQLEEEVELWKGVGTGAVTIGVDPEVEISLLPPVLEDFVPAHPNVQVTVRSGHTDSLLPALLSGELHFLVADAELALERDDLDILRLASDPMAVALRPGHPLERKREPTPAEIQSYPIAGAFTAPRFINWSAMRSRQEGVEPMLPSLVSDNYEVLVRLVERSDTVIFGTRAVLSSYGRSGRLKVMPWEVDGPQTSPCLIRSKGRQFSPAAKLLMALFDGSVAHTGSAGTL